MFLEESRTRAAAGVAVFNFLLRSINFFCFRCSPRVLSTHVERVLLVVTERKPCRS